LLASHDHHHVHDLHPLMTHAHSPSIAWWIISSLIATTSHSPSRLVSACIAPNAGGRHTNAEAPSTSRQDRPEDKTGRRRQHRKRRHDGTKDRKRGGATGHSTGTAVTVAKRQYGTMARAQKRGSVGTPVGRGRS
jgi:hypothetical protein